ncbi:unnamed protein product [Arctia plantaginis]|uniref:Reverse transcriptase RNase H-like domain-containing protein n=1 Tax=Arctia plantaginis TaxID=874455 RepID=A0A8S1BEG8_ARCPL|nr:unnamed protein product [Arctia plantaginis]
MVSWYRRFISNFSTRVAPLTKLTRKTPKGGNFLFDEEASRAFKEIKSLLITAPILSVPKFDRPFIISTDASDVGLGCILSQLDDEGDEHPVAFASRSLTRSERNYTTTEKELYALLFALEKFRGYIDGSPFQTKVYTDHSSLRWLVNLKSPTGRLARWAIRLSQYNFIVEHRKAAEQAAPDALSRAPASDELFKFQASVLALEGDSWYSGMFKKVSAAPGKFPDWRVLEERLYKRVRNSNPLAVDFLFLGQDD